MIRVVTNGDVDGTPHWHTRCRVCEQVLHLDVPSHTLPVGIPFENDVVPLILIGACHTNIECEPIKHFSKSSF